MKDVSRRSMRNGSELWKNTTRETSRPWPVSYRVNGKQYVAIAAAHALFACGPRDRNRHQRRCHHASLDKLTADTLGRSSV